MVQSTLMPREQEQRGEANRIERHTGANTWRNIRLITGREYKNQVTQRSFKITSILFLTIIVLGAFVPTVIQFITMHTGATSQTKMVIINNAGNVVDMNGDTLLGYIKSDLKKEQNATENAHFSMTMRQPTKLSETRDQVKNGDLNILLLIERSANQDLDFTYYTTDSDPTNSNLTQVQTTANRISMLDRAARQHLSPPQVNSLLAQPQFTITNLQEKPDGRSVADIVTGIVLAYVGTILISLAIQMYSVGVAQGVAEEKGHHIMEILVIAATPFQLMVGKIVGIGAAGLTQMGGLVLVGISMLALQTPIKAALFGDAGSSFAINITGTSIVMLLLVLLYFILSFLLYSSLYAVAGSLVTRPEEGRNAGGPITLLFMVGYIISVSFTAIPGVPDSLWVKILSYIPFWSPTLMLMRIGAGTVEWWEILLTVVLMALTIPACAWISARIYRLGVLADGQRFTLKRLGAIFRAG
jgi:ABC-2 type transport system permease protein